MSALRLNLLVPALMSFALVATTIGSRASAQDQHPPATPPKATAAPPASAPDAFAPTPTPPADLPPGEGAVAGHPGAMDSWGDGGIAPYGPYGPGWGGYGPTGLPHPVAVPYYYRSGYITPTGWFGYNYTYPYPGYYAYPYYYGGLLPGPLGTGWYNSALR